MDWLSIYWTYVQDRIWSTRYVYYLRTHTHTQAHTLIRPDVSSFIYCIYEHSTHHDRGRWWVEDWPSRITKKGMKETRRRWMLHKFHIKLNSLSVIWVLSNLNFWCLCDHQTKYFFFSTHTRKRSDVRRLDFAAYLPLSQTASSIGRNFI